MAIENALCDAFYSLISMFWCWYLDACYAARDPFLFSKFVRTKLLEHLNFLSPASWFHFCDFFHERSFSNFPFLMRISFHFAFCWWYIPQIQVGLTFCFWAFSFLLPIPTIYCSDFYFAIGYFLTTKARFFRRIWRKAGDGPDSYWTGQGFLELRFPIYYGSIFVFPSPCPLPARCILALFSSAEFFL